MLFPFAAPDFPPESHRMWDLRCSAAGRARWSPFGTGGALKCSVGFPPQALISGELDILKDWCYEAVSEAPRDGPRAWGSPLEMGLFWGVFCLAHCEFELAGIQGLPGSRAFPDSVGGLLFGSSFLPSYCAVKSKFIVLKNPKLWCCKFQNNSVPLFRS